MFCGTNGVADFVAKFVKLNGLPQKKTFTKVVKFLRARRQNPAKTEENVADLVKNVADFAEKVKNPNS